MKRSPPFSALAITVSLAGLAAAVGLRWLLDPVLGNSSPLVTMLAAIGVAVWIGGYRAALVVAVPGFLLFDYLFIQPRREVGFGEGGEAVRIVLYLAASAIIVGFGEALHRARERSRRGEEEALRQAELVRTTLASIGDGVITTDPDGRITSMNAMAETLTGWTAAEGTGLPLTEVVRLVTEPREIEPGNPKMRAAEDGVITGLASPAVLRAKDGTERVIDERTAPIRSGEGEALGYVLVFRDITERHRGEELQRSAQEQIATTLESVTDGFMRYDRDWRIVYVNAEAERINRLTRGEMLGRIVWEVFPTLAGTQFEEEFRRAVAEQVTIEFENYYEPFGRWYTLKGYPTEDGGLTTFIRDITKQKESEQALRLSEERWEFVRRSSGVGFWYCDLPFDVLQWDEQVKAHFHLAPDAEVTIHTFYDRIHPDDREPTREAIELSIANRLPYDVDYRTVDPETETVTWVRAIGRTFYAGDGTPIRFDGVTLDVSDRKRIEREVVRIAADSERQRRLYETVLTNTPDFVYVFSLDHRVLYANDALIKMWGRGQEGAIGKTFLEIGYEPWHAAMHDREIDEVRATRKPIRGEVPFQGTNGLRQYDYIFVPIIGPDGEVEAVAGTTRDVTERKETEKQLREGQEQLDFALAAADLGYLSLNLADHTTLRTLRHDQLFGYDTLQPVWTYEMFLEHVVPADRAAVDAAFQKSVVTGAPWAVECRIRRVDGVVRHLWKKGLARRDAEGKVERMVAIVGDITERRQHEERQAFLVRLADTLRPLSDPVDVQAEASRVLGEWLGANRVVYFEVQGDEYVVERDYTDAALPMAGRYPVGSFGPDLLAAYRAGDTVCDPDVNALKSRTAEELETFASVQIGAYVGVPLVKDGTFVAGLGVHSAGPRGWTPTEIAIIEDTAERTWAAVGRVRAEEALRLSEERFRTVFESMDEGFCVIGMEFDTGGRPVDYRIEVMNPAFGKHTGMQGLVGQSIRQAIPALEEFWYETYGRVASTGEPARFIHQAEPMGGRWFDVSAFRLGRAGSNKVAILFNDISDRKVAEVERERLVGQLQDQDKRKDEFLATLAHELRNPLAPISNGLQIMRLAGVTGSIEEARAMMERQLTQLIRLVDDLLDVSRVTSGKLALRRERVELRAILDAAVETSRPIIEQEGHELEVVLPHEPISVDGDATRLAQVVSNLLHNSAKYTPQGGHIRLSVRREQDMAVVVVADNGIGIPPHMVGNVFAMFAQVDRTLEKTTGGLGIGLSLVKGLVEMHGGTIEARSEGEGRGSEFIARLPVVSSVAGDSSPPVAVGAADPPAGAVRRRRILVADDNVDSAQSLGRLLGLIGNDVEIAHDGLQAVEAAEAFRPDVLLLDIGMPRLNGYEVCRRIRGQPWGRHVILVAMTGWGQEEDKRRSHEAGFNVHLVKPVDFRAIKQLLSSLKPEMD